MAGIDLLISYYCLDCTLSNLGCGGWNYLWGRASPSVELSGLMPSVELSDLRRAYMPIELNYLYSGWRVV